MFIIYYDVTKLSRYYSTKEYCSSKAVSKSGNIAVISCGLKIFLKKVIKYRFGFCGIRRRVENRLSDGVATTTNQCGVILIRSNQQ
jgi:hypothetical protein